MLLEVGTIVRAHGLRGEVVVELVSNRDGRMAAGSRLEGPQGALTIESATPLPASGLRTRWLVRFAGVDDRTAAEALRGTELRAEPLGDDDGALWVHELVGSAVVDQSGTTLGTVTDLQANPASDLLVLDSGVLVPLAFVVTHAPGRVDVDVPPGLTDL